MPVLVVVFAAVPDLVFAGVLDAFARAVDAVLQVIDVLDGGRQLVPVVRLLLDVHLLDVVVVYVLDLLRHEDNDLLPLAVAALDARRQQHDRSQQDPHARPGPHAAEMVNPEGWLVRGARG